MEADDSPTRHHDDTLLCHIRTVHRITYRRSRRTLVYGVHRARTRDDVDHHELILTCGIVVLYGKIPENNRGDPRISNPILGNHPRIHHGRRDPWYGDRSDRTRCGHVFHPYRICSYRTHDTLRIPHVTPLRSGRTPELTRSR